MIDPLVFGPELVFPDMAGCHVLSKNVSTFFCYKYDILKYNADAT